MGYFSQARKRLLNLVASQNQGRILLLSGDRHIGEFASLTNGAEPMRLVEITSSGLTHSWTDFPGEPNRHRIGEVYSEISFGTIDIDWTTRSMSLSIRDIDGSAQGSLERDF